VKYWLDIYHQGASLAVTGRIRDIGESVNILFKQEAVAVPSPVIFTFSFLFTLFEEAFIRNIILLCINYIIC